MALACCRTAQSSLRVNSVGGFVTCHQCEHMLVRVTVFAVDVSSPPTPGVNDGLHWALDFSKVFHEGLISPTRKVWQASGRCWPPPSMEEAHVLGDRMGGTSRPFPTKHPCAHPQTEFAKRSSEAINMLHRESPHFFLNKRIPEELVYSQIAMSANDPPSLVLRVTQMAVDKDLASCSKCQGCQWG